MAKRSTPPDAAALAAHVQAQLESERTRLARRLHGDVAGMLAAARMDLSRIANHKPADAALREQVLHVDQILDAVIHNAREEMQRLHPALLDHFGLSAAVRHMVEEVCRASGAEFALLLPEFANAGLPDAVALAAYRVVERLLQGPALRRVSVRLRQSGDGWALVIDIERDGALSADARNDLAALCAWLESLGGAWLEAERGAACTVELALPRQDPAMVVTTAG